MSKPFTVTRAEARELKRRADKMDRQGGVPFETVRKEWLEDMKVELQGMAKAYRRTGKGAKELLEALLIAEVEGAPGVTEIRHALGETVRKRKAA